MPQQVVVIGAGVIGLSSAVLLQEAGYTVTIVAKDFPGPFETTQPLKHINYTSPWAGAHNRWVPPTASGELVREHGLALVTFTRIEYLEAPPPEYIALTEEHAALVSHLPGFRLLSPESFPDNRIAWGCEYDTWSLNPMVYCSFLLRRFVFRGGQVRQRELRALAELFAVPTSELGFEDAEGDAVIDAVVNASGYGFGDDPSMSITRGQTCLVANPCDATITRQNMDGSWTFGVPRGFEGGTIIGGTKEPDNWSATPSTEVRERLLKSFAETYPAALGDSNDFTVIADIVGRRPTRKGGPRLEGETVQEGGFVMHAYGLGGRRFELSWGVAEEVVKGVNSHLKGC